MKETKEYGEIITNPDLADTLEGVARNGVDWFYNGPVADDIVKHVQKHKGILVKEDLEKCINSILGRSSYSNYEILVVENNSTSQEIFEYYKQLAKRPKVRLLKWKRNLIILQLIICRCQGKRGISSFPEQ